MEKMLRETLRGSVREEYRVLLRAEAELILPDGLERICEFYRKTGEACLSWILEGEGERMRAEYNLLSDTAEKARFRAAHYRMECRPVWERESYAAWVCRSVLFCRGEESTRLMAQVWDLSEQTVLPTGQILRLCPPLGKKKRPPFRADGVYPQNGELVFYRNSIKGMQTAEFRVPFRQ